MYLFNKRTRNIIKAIWAVFAVLIMVSMIIVYSGFTMLVGPANQAVEPRDVSFEDLEAAPGATSSLSTSSPEIQELLKSIQADMATGTPSAQGGATPQPTTPTQPPVPELNFGI